MERLLSDRDTQPSGLTTWFDKPRRQSRRQGIRPVSQRSLSAVCQPCPRTSVGPHPARV